MTREALIDAWDRFADRVARGYPDSINDYANDLTLRTRIAELERGAAPLSAALARSLAASDARFREVTIEVESPFAGYQAPREAWWWFRRPKVLGRVLEADLGRVGQA